MHRVEIISPMQSLVINFTLATLVFSTDKSNYVLIDGEKPMDRFFVYRNDVINVTNPSRKRVRFSYWILPLDACIGGQYMMKGSMSVVFSYERSIADTCFFSQPESRAYKLEMNQLSPFTVHGPSVEEFNNSFLISPFYLVLEESKVYSIKYSALTQSIASEECGLIQPYGQTSMMDFLDIQCEQESDKMLRVIPFVILVFGGFYCLGLLLLLFPKVE